MVLSHSSGYEEWTIETYCREDNPVDWRPGDQLVFAVRGFAEFSKPPAYGENYTSLARIDIREEATPNFYRAQAGHDHVRDELRKQIDERKKSPTS
jgi:hypothetical protein